MGECCLFPKRSLAEDMLLWWWEEMVLGEQGSNDRESFFKSDISHPGVTQWWYCGSMLKVELEPLWLPGFLGLGYERTAIKRKLQSNQVWRRTPWSGAGERSAVECCFAEQIMYSVIHVQLLHRQLNRGVWGQDRGLSGHAHLRIITDI